MKKLLFVFMTVGLIVSASSCKKCGYCIDVNGNHSQATCKQNGVLGTVDNSYQQAEADCQSQGGHWELTK